MVLDCVADKLTDLLIGLLDVLPALYVFSTMSSIIFLQINKSVEMADSEVNKVNSRVPNLRYVYEPHPSPRISCKSEAASRRIRSRPTRTSFFTPLNLFNRFRTTSYGVLRLMIPNSTVCKAMAHVLYVVQYLRIYDQCRRAD